MNFRRLTCPSVGLFLHSGANAARTASLTGPFRQDLFREDLIRKDLIPNGFAFRPRGLGHRCPIDARRPESLLDGRRRSGEGLPQGADTGSSVLSCEPLLTDRHSSSPQCRLPATRPTSRPEAGRAEDRSGRAGGGTPPRRTPPRPNADQGAAGSSIAKKIYRHPAILDLCGTRHWVRR